MKVLVIDDDPSMRLYIRDVLEGSFHCEVIEAGNGLEAWNILDSGTEVEICTVDIRMPVMEGLEFTAKLRHDARFRKQKVLFCSSVTERSPVIQAASLGTSEYLFKPFIGAALEKSIRKLCDLPASVSLKVN